MKYDIAISYKSALNQEASHIADYLIAGKCFLLR